MIERLETAFRSGFETAEWEKLCSERGMEPVFMDRKQFKEFALSQARFFGEEVPELLRLKR